MLTMEYGQEENLEDKKQESKTESSKKSIDAKQLQVIGKYQAPVAIIKTLVKTTQILLELHIFTNGKVFTVLYN